MGFDHILLLSYCLLIIFYMTPTYCSFNPLRDHDTHEMWEEAVSARRNLVEAVAELDEGFMEVYLAAEEVEGGVDLIDSQVLLGALRRVSIQGLLMPALCGASLRGKGVEPLLDSLVAFLPSPLGM
jgi:elongation factor G